MLPVVRPQAVGRVTIPPVPEIMHAVSVDMNPLPLRVTIVPTTPEPRFRISDGVAVTVNGYVATSPPGLPVTVMV
jgi:hypothetical protein